MKKREKKNVEKSRKKYKGNFVYLLRKMSIYDIIYAR